MSHLPFDIFELELCDTTLLFKLTQLQFHLFHLSALDTNSFVLIFELFTQLFLILFILFLDLFLLLCHLFEILIRSFSRGLSLLLTLALTHLLINLLLGLLYLLLILLDQLGLLLHHLIRSSMPFKRPFNFALPDSHLLNQ